MLQTVIGTVAVAYIAILLTLTVFQRFFIYPALKGEGRDVPGFEQVLYPTADGLDLMAGYKPAGDGKPTIVYFHGNGADWQSSVVATDRLTPAGYGVFAAEYRGYRGNPGSPSEDGLYADGRAALTWLKQRGVAGGDIVLVGNSIGSGVASQLATEFDPRALVLISPFASLPQIAGEKLWWLPVRAVLRDQFDNKAKIGEIAAPILLLHGDADTLIPDHHSRELAAMNSAARLVIFPNAGHELAWHDAAEREMLAFLEELDAQDRNR
ncbi:alpha/beta fold hydrolase [Altererythrobacter arenosus]|uniref:Alpha/beta fold hydrolase n=1 Tax=Altererythrobacter arenosus TaxID=3032592 RepID=A0ABY8FU83_9SPHN|nr:alpha/beta fold hydrolase [Altererythrobacter sp. CAU 1644]WFL78540.1 alpha/beta fold hydrolase [Altererythrobacter sp. CAU 1644]